MSSDFLFYLGLITKLFKFEFYYFSILKKIANSAIIRNNYPEIPIFYKKIFLYKFRFRSERQISKRQVKIDIEISDFFEITAFKSESKENDNIRINLKHRKILMSGELEQEMLGICKNGGIH